MNGMNQASLDFADKQIGQAERRLHRLKRLAMMEPSDENERAWREADGQHENALAGGIALEEKLEQENVQ